MAMQELAERVRGHDILTCLADTRNDAVASCALISRLLSHIQLS
jgi:hypothetical protein